MTKRRAFWSFVLLLFVGALAVLLPSSPAYAPKLFARYVTFYDGHGAGHWTGKLDDPDPEVRGHAAFALGMLGGDSEGAVPALARLMVDDPEVRVRVEASLALSKLGKLARGAVPALARALADSHQLVRMNAARTLLELGREARPAAPELVKAMKDAENDSQVGTFELSVREVATVALGRATAGSDEGVAPLVEALEGAHTDGMRRAAARGLGEVGASARSAEPQLRALLKHEDESVRWTAGVSLKQIGAGAPPPG